MLDRLIRREKRSAAVVMAAVFTGLFLVMVALVFVSANDSNLALGLCICFSGLLVPATIVVVAICGSRFAQDLTENRLNLLLSPYGELRELIRQVDSEIESGCCRNIRGKQNRSALITNSWLLMFSPSEFWIVSVPDILWAFKRICVEPPWWAGDRLIYQVCCVMGVDRIYHVQVPDESCADDTLQVLIERRPEVLFGYRGEWCDLAARGRRAMQAEIARLREEWDLLNEEGRDDWHIDRLNDAENFVRRVDPQVPDDGGVKIGPD